MAIVVRGDTPSQEGTMHECKQCGSFVTTDFVRVFGNNRNQVYGCPDCMTYADLIEGEGSKPGA